MALLSFMQIQSEMFGVVSQSYRWNLKENFIRNPPTVHESLVQLRSVLIHAPLVETIKLKPFTMQIIWPDIVSSKVPQLYILSILLFRSPCSSADDAQDYELFSIKLPNRI